MAFAASGRSSDQAGIEAGVGAAAEAGVARVDAQRGGGDVMSRGAAFDAQARDVDRGLGAQRSELEVVGQGHGVRRALVVDESGHAGAQALAPKAIADGGEGVEQGASAEHEATEVAESFQARAVVGVQVGE